MLNASEYYPEIPENTIKYFQIINLFARQAPFYSVLEPRLIQNQQVLSEKIFYRKQNGC